MCVRGTLKQVPCSYSFAEPITRSWGVPNGGKLGVAQEGKKGSVSFNNKNDGTYLRMSGNNIATESRKQKARKEHATAVKRDS
jgi:hypothetical protein